MVAENSNRIRAADLFDLTGQVALVTGASSGLGRRFAETLAANGAKVVCVARRKNRLDTLVKEISKSGGSALAIEADVTDRKTVRKAFDQAERRFGPVTILVNNAGIGLGENVIDQPEEIWRRVIQTNLTAVYFTAQIAAQRMVGARIPGSIVNIASTASILVQEGMSAYAASKAAVVQLTRAMAVDLARKRVRVNAIAPGYIYSEMTDAYLSTRAGKAMIQKIPFGRAGDAQDLDGALLLLASDAGRFMTGATVVVDGGHVVAFKE
jgi:3-oxoacyl-[acyl-carrier protein] reductase